MAGEPPTTPERPPEAPGEDLRGGHTRPPAAAEGQNEQQRAKRHRTISVQAPQAGPRKAATPKDATASDFLARQADNISRTIAIRAEVVRALGACLDGFVASWAGESKEDHRREASSLIHDTLGYLGARITAPGKQNETRLPGPVSKTASWADVARSGATQEAAKTTGQSRAKQPARMLKSLISKDKEDIRVLVTLTAANPGEENCPMQEPRLHSFQIRTLLCKDLPFNLSEIPEVTNTNTGYAITPASKTVRDKLIEHKNEIARLCNAQEVTIPTKWFTYAVPNVAYNLSSILGTPVEAETLIAEEVKAQTGYEPTHFWRSRFGPDPQTGRGTFLVAFTHPVRPFKLFGSSEISRLIVKKPQAVRHNPGCQGYCTGNNCQRAPRCPNCSERLEQHENGPCKKNPRCANCLGPHLSDHTNCPAKPKRKEGKLVWLSRRVLKKIRKAGSQRHREVYMQTQTQGDETETENNTARRQPPPHSYEQERDTIIVSSQENITPTIATSRKRTASGTIPPRGTAPHHTPQETATAMEGLHSNRPRRTVERPDYNLVRSADKAFNTQQPTSTAPPSL